MYRVRGSRGPRSEQAADGTAGPTHRGLRGARGPGNERIGVAVPLVSGIVVAEHSSIGLGLAGEAQCQVTFDQALERFRNMRRPLVIIDDALEAVHRRQ